LDRQETAALVERTIAAIDGMTREERDALLFDLLDAAWESLQAQNQ
jgi:hypothetical protein